MVGQDAVKHAKSGLLWQLCSCFFRIGAFTFGGGYAMLPLIRAEVVERKEWLAGEEYIDIIGVAQSAPGAVAINSSIFIGYKLGGLAGAVAATLGMVLPSFIIILLIATVFSRFQDAAAVKAFFRGVRPAVTALIAAAAVKMGKPVLNTGFSFALALAAAIVVLSGWVHPIVALTAGGTAGYFFGQLAAAETEKGNK
ncbi:MAG: chromate transporter [bacterium]|jgi:chromate transporter